MSYYKEIKKAKTIFILSSAVIILLGLFALNFDRFSCLILNHQKEIDNIWQLSQEIQKDNSYEIEVEHVHTDPSFKPFRSFIKLIKTPNMWYVQHQEYSNSGKLSSTKNIRLYDNNYIYKYLTTEEGKTPDMFGPYGAVYYDAKSEHSEYIKYNPNTTLKDSINRENFLNNLINWYHFDADANPNNWFKDETPRIIENRTMNGYKCTYIQFYKNENPVQERYACVSKDYGIAVYHKLVIVPPAYKAFNTPITHEYFITKIKDTNKSNYRADYSIFNIPKNMYIRSEQQFAKEPG